jgi:hypothetical protein
MTTSLLLVSLLATVPTPATEESVAELRAPDWAAEFAEPAARAPSAGEARETATALQADLAADLAADAVLATRAGQRLVLSALLCEAVQRKSDTGDKLEVLLTADVLAADKRADRDIESDRERLAVLGITPLACDAYPVERIVQCFSLLPSASCTEDDDLADQVHAAEKLATP